MPIRLSRHAGWHATRPLALATPAWAAGPTLLNVSDDVSLEFYKDANTVFAAHWKKTTGEEVTVNQGHGGCSRQARSAADGLDADVMTMNQHHDIDILAEAMPWCRATGPGGWTKAQKDHFNDGATDDQVIAAAKPR